MSRNWIFVAVSAVALGVFIAGRALSADPKNPAADSKDVFAGKVISVSSKSQGEFGAVLEKVVIRELSGKSFLVGTAVDTGEGHDWTKGRITWCPIDDAGQIVEFDSVQQLKRAHAAAVP